MKKHSLEHSQSPTSPNFLPLLTPVLRQIALLLSQALSEESGSAIKSGPPVVSCGNLTPFGKGVRSAEFEVMAAAKMTLLVKTVVN